jgi:hypothetical protein
MTLRRCWPLCWLLCLGCYSLVGLPPDDEPAVASPQAEEHAPATPAAVTQPAQDPKAGQSPPHNPMSLAAAALEKGDEPAACVHLGRYLTAHPDHFEIRSYYAELLLRQRQRQEARGELERFIAGAQLHEARFQRQLVRAHAQLMEIAEAEEDEYHEHLHRGIGLYLLARQRVQLPDPEGKLSVQGLLCRAAGELAQARMERPDEARPCWYLYAVWACLAQDAPARRWLHAASAAAPFSYLTTAEQRSLQLACRSCELLPLRKW